MTAKHQPAPDRTASLDCPKCGAPASLPADLSVVTLTCEYCEQTFAIPQSIRDAQERRLRYLAGPSGSRRPVLAMIIAMTLAGMMVIAVQAFSVKRQAAPNVERAQEPVAEMVATPAPSETHVAPAEESQTTGERRVKELMANYEQAGCRTVLLPATQIIGSRDIDAKLVAKGPCVRLIAASGQGDSLELTMKTPRGKAVSTPVGASEVDFLYCAKQAGLHPATIRSSSEQPFTVASIECPRQ